MASRVALLMFLAVPLATLAVACPNDDSSFFGATVQGSQLAEAGTGDVPIPGQDEDADPPNDGPGEPPGDEPPLDCPRGGEISIIRVSFDCNRVQVESCKDLSNVVIECEDGTRVKFDGLSGHRQSFAHEDGCELTRTWVKAGANHSGDGPGFGEAFEAPADNCDDGGDDVQAPPANEPPPNQDEPPEDPGDPSTEPLI